VSIELTKVGNKKVEFKTKDDLKRFLIEHGIDGSGLETKKDKK
jgi:hypothetical protein